MTDQPSESALRAARASFPQTAAFADEGAPAAQEALIRRAQEIDDAFAEERSRAREIEAQRDQFRKQLESLSWFQGATPENGRVIPHDIFTALEKDRDAAQTAIATLRSALEAVQTVSARIVTAIPEYRYEMELVATALDTTTPPAAGPSS